MILSSLIVSCEKWQFCAVRPKLPKTVIDDNHDHVSIKGVISLHLPFLSFPNIYFHSRDTGSRWFLYDFLKLQLRLFAQFFSSRWAIRILPFPLALVCVVAILQALLTAVGGGILLPEEIDHGNKYSYLDPKQIQRIYIEKSRGPAHFHTGGKGLVNGFTDVCIHVLLAEHQSGCMQILCHVVIIARCEKS